MIDVAYDLKWIDFDAQQFTHVLRHFRNLIHPYQQMLLELNPDKDTCEASYQAIKLTVNDLLKIPKK